MTAYLAQIAFGAFALGVILFVLDGIFGVSWYRKYYDLTSRVPLAADVVRGFVVGQNADGKFTIAVLLVLAQGGYLFWTRLMNPLTLIFTALVEVPCMVAGFYAGPLVARLWERRKPILDVVDKLESGELKVGEELKHVAQAARDRFAGPDAPASEPVEASETPAATEPPIDERRLIDGYTGKTRSVH